MNDPYNTGMRSISVLLFAIIDINHKFYRQFLIKLEIGTREALFCFA